VPQTRITGGDFRGRVVETPRGSLVRPTRGMVRESLFDILGDRVADAAVLDLYAGSGALGFEALSRGAAQVTFVERDERALRAISATAARFGCADRCHPVRSDVVRFLRHHGDDVAATALCFMDAPYRDPELEVVLQCLGSSPPALVVCEHHRRRALPGRAGLLRRAREVRHGLTTLTFYQPAAPGDEQE